MKKIIIILIFAFVLTGCHQEFGKIEIKKTKPQYITAPENNTFKIGANNFQTETKTDITADSPLQYKLGDKYISFRPMMMRFDNDFDNIKKPTANTHKIAKKKEWKNIFGNNIDLKLKTSARIWHKEVIINSLKDIGKIPKDAKYLEVWFEIKTNMIIDGWDKESKFYLSMSAPTRLGDYSYIDMPMAWDSYNEIATSTNEDGEIIKKTLTNKIKVESYLINSNKKKYYIKLIPIEWLEKAEYPVYTDADIEYGTAVEFNANATQHIKVTEINTDKFAVAYADSAVAGEAIVGSVSGTTVSFGSESEFEADCQNYAKYAMAIGIAKLDTDKFSVAYVDDSDDDGWTRAVTVSGTAIGAWGTAYEFLSGDAEYIDAVGIDTNQFALVYNRETPDDDGQVQACSVVGTTTTCGALQEWCTGTNKFHQITKLDTDKFVACGNCAADNTADLDCIVGTVGVDNAIMLGSKKEIYDWDNAGSFTEGFALTSPSTDNFTITYADDNDSLHGDVLACTVSTRTITAGSPTEYSNNSPTDTTSYTVESTSIDATHFVIVYADVGDFRKGKSNYMTVDFSDRTIIASTPEIFEAGSTGGSSGDESSLDIALISTNKIIICYMDDDDSDKGKCIAGILEEEAAARRIFTVY